MIQRTLVKRLHPSSLRSPFTPHHRSLSALSTRLPTRLSPTPTPSPSLATLQRRTFAQPALDTMVTAAAPPPLPKAPAVAAKDYGNFKLLQSFDLPHAPVNVSKWRSDKTGLTVVLGHHSSPITSGYFVIASEIFDDTGRPHTLEHLVFLGSKSYPYKGVLDHLANRAGSDGTNAWTANDHTAYTMESAGSKGFLNMLPIYVDHILHPTMTDAGFVTEVHHINGEGEDAGVVYSEMQGRENQCWDRMALKLQRTLYPETSAYRSETGGLLARLRVLTAQMIREYHQKYYVPHNLCLVMDGAVNPEELFSVLNEKVEPMILEQQGKSPATAGPFVPPAGWKRPFVETTTSKPNTIAKSEDHIVEFMEEDESNGNIMITWLGPAPNDYVTDLALDVLASYLSESATSPLMKEFVEIAEPLATSIGFMSEARVNKSELALVATGVPRKLLSEMPNLIKAKLAKIVNEEGIDMARMELMLRRERRNTLNTVESRVSAALSNGIIQDFLYGEKDGKELPKTFNDLADFAVIEQWTAKDWTDLISKYLLATESITTIGKPSAKLSSEIEKNEKERVAEQKAKYGEEGLKKLAEELEAAKKESDKPVPNDMLTAFPATKPSDLSWIPVETAINKAPGDSVNSDKGAVQAHIDADGATLPYQAHFAHVASNFVVVSTLLDTTKIAPNLLPYVAVFRSALFNAAVKRADGTVLNHEEVVNQLDDLTVHTNAHFGVRNVFPESIQISLKVEKERYPEAVEWLRDVLAGTQFTKDRLEVIVAKEVQNLPDRKRSGRTVARSVLSNLVYDSKRSPAQNSGLLNQLESLPRIADEIRDEPEKVIAALEEIRGALVRPEVLRVSVAGDILSLPAPRSTLAKSFLPIEKATERLPHTPAFEFLTELGAKPAKTLELVPMAAIEGSYSEHHARGPVGFDHPDVPAMIVTTKVLNTMESYLWKAIRGSGLAYGAYLDFDLESGSTSFSVQRSPNAFLAYREAAKVLKELADGNTEIDQNIVDGACASEAYSFAQSAATVSRAASMSYVDEVLKGKSKTYSQDLLNKLSDVTIPDIRACIAKYYVKLFDPATSIAAVAVNSGKADEVEAAFKEFGFVTSRRELPTLGADSDSECGSESGSESGSEDGVEAEKVK